MFWSILSLFHNWSWGLWWPTDFDVDSLRFLNIVLWMIWGTVLCALDSKQFRWGEQLTCSLYSLQSCKATTCVRQTMRIAGVYCIDLVSRYDVSTDAAFLSPSLSKLTLKNKTRSLPVEPFDLEQVFQQVHCTCVNCGNRTQRGAHWYENFQLKKKSFPLTHYPWNVFNLFISR